jgi:hypothetical protein
MEPQQPTQGRFTPLVLKEQNELIIRACCLYQFMTVIDMAYLLDMPTSLNYVRKVVAGLAGKKDQVPGHYLYRFPLPQRSGGNALRVFVPGEASRNLLHLEDDADGYIWNNPVTMQGYSYSFVYHNLAVTRVALCASVFCRENPEYYLAETRLSYDISRNAPRVSLTTDEKQSPVSVIPDCWLFIERVSDGQRYALWVEVDNATQFRKSFQRRLSARLELIKGEGYASYFGTPAVLLCYAVLGKTPELRDARMHTLRGWTHGLLVEQKRTQFAPLFRFTALDYDKLYEQKRTLFTGPIWYLPEDPKQENPQHVSLLPTPQTQEERDGNDPHPNAESTVHHTDSGNMCQDPPQRESVSGLAF